MAKKIGRDGTTIIEDLGDGTKISISQTSAGVRAHRHDGSTTTSIDPASIDVSKVVRSQVGGGQARITVTKPNGEATDITRRGDGSLDEQTHDGGTTRKK